MEWIRGEISRIERLDAIFNEYSPLDKGSKIRDGISKRPKSRCVRIPMILFFDLLGFQLPRRLFNPARCVILSLSTRRVNGQWVTEGRSANPAGQKVRITRTLNPRPTSTLTPRQINLQLSIQISPWNNEFIPNLRVPYYIMDFQLQFGVFLKFVAQSLRKLFDKMLGDAEKSRESTSQTFGINQTQISPKRFEFPKWGRFHIIE